MGRFALRAEGSGTYLAQPSCSPAVSLAVVGVQQMSLGTILLIVLILVLLGVIPTWGHSRSWGYGPSGIVGVIVVILVVLLLMGRL